MVKLALAAYVSPFAVQAELPVPCGSCGNVPAFVTSGQAQYSSNGNTGTITQQSDRAILNWQRFNVGAGNKVEFKQPSSTAATLNRIHQQDPSRILGTIEANGQVLLLNQNGFVFGNGAKVNTRALTASTLGISDQVFNTLGLTGAIGANPTEPAETGALPAFDGTTNPNAKIEIEPGAALNAKDRIFIVAPEIVNGGSLTTPDGQTILAASKDKVYLTTDAETRGLLVEVGTGGTVSNLGNILSERGNTTLVGLAVNQNGRVQATTSVNVNGSIKLQARDRAKVVADLNNPRIRKPVATRSGTLNFGENSVTQVTPDQDTATAVDAQPQSLSKIEAMAQTINVRSGALVEAPGGTIEMTATRRPDAPGTGGDRSSKITLDAGSRVTVSGERSAVVAMERNQGSIKLFGNELAGSPVQRNGILRGKEITVDLRRGTKIADVSKLYGEIKRDVRERLASGGTLKLASEGDVIMQPGATLGIAGGAVRYADGYLDPTRLIRAGRVIDIADADPGTIYDGIFGELDVTHRKWGMVESFTAFHNAERAGFTSGYVEGKDAGALQVSGAGITLDGLLDGTIVTGRWQLEAPGNASGLSRPYTETPLGGMLVLSKAGTETATNVIFRASRNTVLRDLAQSLPEGLPLTLSPDLFGTQGIARVTINTVGQVNLPAGLALEMGPFGYFELNARTITLDGQIHAPGGVVKVTATRRGELLGEIALNNGAEIDVSGEWRNDSPVLLRSPATHPTHALDAGKITLNSQGDLKLAHGSRLDVSAGAQLTRDGNLAYGRAGDVDLRSRIPDDARRTSLTLDGQLHGYGFEDFGSLRLDAPAFALGSGSATPGTVLLGSRFFSERGFGDIRLNADRGSIVFRAGSSLELMPLTRALDGTANRQLDGASLDNFTSLTLLPDYALAPTSLSASISRSPLISHANARLIVEAGASLLVTPAGRIALSADSDVVVNGTLRAPAGSIALGIGLPSNVNERGYRADQAIAVGASAQLDVRGVTRITQDQSRLRQGDVLPGGTIEFTANRGFVAIAPGARLDVSGTQGLLDLPSANQVGRFDAKLVGSDAGSVSLSAAEAIFIGAQLTALPGTPNARGGTLRVALNPNLRDPAFAVATDVGNVNLTQFLNGARTIKLRHETNSVPNFGTALTAAQNGFAQVPVSLLQGSGIDVLRLVAEPLALSNGSAVAGRIETEGALSLTLGRQLALDATVIAASRGVAQLAAPLVTIGPSNNKLKPTPPPLALGDGRLQISAQHLELQGDVRFDKLLVGGPAALSLSAQQDTRLRGNRFGGESHRFYTGSLTTLADVELSAARLYPTTLTDYLIDLPRAESNVSITANGTSSTPLSAGGRLTISAGNITQRGNVLAPFGEIRLNATNSITLSAGSLTSVSGTGALVPFGVLEIGADWIYPLGDATKLVAQAPAKLISLQAPRISLQSSSLVDLGGGGDLLAYEFVRGPGGPTDILTSDNKSGAFAVLPGLNLFGAFDPFESARAPLASGDIVTFNANQALPPGSYSRLPARYALLPGAFLVTPLSDFRDVSPFASPVLGDGATAFASGYYGHAGTNVLDSRSQGFIVESNAQVRQRAEYQLTQGDQFFATQASGAPRDAGQLTLAATQAIELAGVLNAATNGGREALVDFAAERLDIVDRRTGALGRVEILADELNNFGDANLLLGGVRARQANQASMSVTARDVSVSAQTKLRARELIFAARDNVTLRDGVKLESNGVARSDGITRYDINGNGALLRTSADAQVTVARSNVTGTTGTLTVESGATLTASGSITLDATRDLRFDGSLATAGSLSMAASRINLGDAPNNVSGLRLTSSQLSGLNAAEILFRSFSTVDIYDNTDLATNSLVIDAAGVRGFANGPSNLRAQRIQVGNSRGTILGAAGTGLGALSLTANTFETTGGNFAFSGFDNVSASLAEAFIATGEGTLAIASDFSVSAPDITAASGARLNLDIAGRFSTAASSAPAIPASALGARVEIHADDIVHAGSIRLPSGYLALTARTGDISVADNAVLDVGGGVRDFAGEQVGTPGGTLRLAATLGDLTIGDHAQLNVAGGASAGDGILDLAAPLGLVTLAPSFALAGSGGGSLAIAANSLAGEFVTAGTTRDTLRLALRQGDLTLGAFAAENISVALDAGSLTLTGALDARAGNGGRVRLYASDTVTIASGATIDASATSFSNGGRIEIGTLTSLALQNGATLTVNGRDANGQPNDSGTIHLRAPRRGGNDVAVDDFSSTFIGAGSIALEAVKSFTATTIDSALSALVIGDANTYFTAAQANVENRLGVTQDSRFHLIPGIELVSPGTLSLANDWDLRAARFDGQAAVLTLRAANSLDFAASLTDGITNEIRANVSTPRDVVQAGESSSYRLVAGARLNSADPLGLEHGNGSLTVHSGRMVRTGNGRIDIATAGDLTLEADAAVYTAGRNRGTGVLAERDAEVLLRGDFVTAGGDLNVWVGGMMRQAAAPILPDWMPRLAGEFIAYNPGVLYPASWAIDVSKFRGLGTLAGGRLEAFSHLGIEGVTFANPTNGMPLSMVSGALDISGGGVLQVTTDGPISGGQIFIGAGRADIVTHEGTQANPWQSNLLPIIALGDAHVSLSSRTAVQLETTYNPTITEPDVNQGLIEEFFFPQPAYFFTYGERSALKLSSLGGEVVLSANGERIREIYTSAGDPRALDGATLTFLPGTIEAIAFDGAIRAFGQLSLLPASRGNLTLYAGKTITADGTASIEMSDADLSTLPTTETPSNALQALILRQLLAKASPRPVHGNDPTLARVVSREGSIGTEGSASLSLVLPKPVLVNAAEDISNLSLALQHTSALERSEVRAGNDIRYTTARSSTGSLLTNSREISIAGPGDLDLIAGRTIDFGSALGVQSKGNLENPSLAEQGANLNLWSGYRAAPALATFARQYLEGPNAPYVAHLTAELSKRGKSSFAGLSEADQRQLVAAAFYGELIASGLESSNGKGFTRGEQAIATLFPTRATGDLKSFLSRVTTRDGGDISLLVPSGLVNAGVASSGTSSNNGNSGSFAVGVIAQSIGDISAFTQGDFLVNASRVFALDGGDILIWSETGNIDAGRGARSALTIPPPTISFDDQGNPFLVFSNAISGSGIQAAVSSPGLTPGDVFLFAPKGVVDAGEAGISSAGNLTIAATAVLGADNISVGGASTGVPSASVAVPVGLASTSAAASSATKSATSGASSSAGTNADGDSLAKDLASSLASLISVQVIGFGE